MKNLYSIKNEKLLSLYWEVEEKQQDFTSLRGWRLPHEYYALSGLGLLLANVDTQLHLYEKLKDKSRFTEKLNIGIAMISGIISDVVFQIEVSKNSFFGFFKIKNLREKRDRYLDVLGLYRKVLSVIERM